MIVFDLIFNNSAKALILTVNDLNTYKCHFISLLWLLRNQAETSQNLCHCDSCDID